ncbi:MAG: MBL fold metallo-hydrolase [bacterium]|nr:MBL fold metallo-hydrolase [bacterium]
MENIKKHTALYFMGVLFAANFFIWYAVSAEEHGILTVAFLDVGQGDAIFIESPTGKQIILDGGPDGSVLSHIGALLPFYDRSIDMLIVSNPDKDHFAGFIDVLKNYQVGKIMEPGTIPDTEIYKIFKEFVREEGSTSILARRGMVIDLGGGAYLQILFPDRDVSGLSTNDGSIIAKLVYGNTSFLLPGDTTQNIEKYLVRLDGSNLDVDVLKLAHHGSKTSSSEPLLAVTTPKYAVISAGVKNRYGHPHKEVLDRLLKYNIPALGTYKDGTIIFESDGERLWRE